MLKQENSSSVAGDASTRSARTSDQHSAGGAISDARLKRVRRFAIWTFLKLALALGVLFALVRVVIPNLVNAHDDALGLLGLLSAFSVPVIAGWAAVSLFISTRRFLGEIGEKE